jgi:hypothetical protein
MVVLAPASTSINAEDTVQLISEYVVRVHGWPKSITTDAGSVFTSKVFAAFCAKNFIQLTILPTNNHAANVERKIGTSRERIRAALHGKAGDWRSQLWAIEFALNITPSAKDGLSAFQRDYGYQPRAHLIQPDPKAAVSASNHVDQSARDLVSLIESFHRQREINVARYDHGRVPLDIKVGDWVCIDSDYYKPTTGDGMSKKMRYVFSEPFQVVADKGHGNWLLAIPSESRINPVFNQQALKPANM